MIIAQDGSPGKTFPLGHTETLIGRNQGDVVLPHDPYIAPLHGRITYRNGRFLLEDLGSENGIYLKLRAETALVDGDLVLLGLEVLRFEVVTPQERSMGPASRAGTRLFGSPVHPRHARLAQQTMEGATRDVYYLIRDETIIGRESGDVVFTSDPYMSRRHARVARTGASATFTLKDLGSSNGTYLKLRGETEITDQEFIRFGQHLFRLEISARPGGSR